MTKRVTH